ncbi:precorrin-2 dehydrogenase/sirohydrochlorin ferrochelatase family protein [Fusobacterium mortiferum]|uniref:precorrin-2 dehydrogenase n=1 Tax=Candidatus Fusobacterium pullicola TaxID=2838601 RepID=A0A9E2KZY2_9FUSO|nr:bifunctional precorrin-2 dehydrogenase/sirohydrochlorin ferrochelatase [Fusobacterium mortiferum]MBM6822420.1 bifunctional precorrin-2 dehydrogenase/sirohydrochlorin ferrochelatase [Fusobacterium mortiferum]MBU3842963.1 bifunctional precorrin-2 dehydrogenase/sirohydrochlorin ferrochelatase [Candidatus Fusobacterium pullicola]
MENNFFPLFIDLRNKSALVIGAGKIAFRKVETLLKYGAKVTVITKEIKEEKFFNLKNIDIKIGEFNETLLENRFIVVAATDNPEFNRYIYELCNSKNILVNNITSKEEMNCRFASILETEEYQIAISANGNPTKSKALKNKLKEIL